MELFRFSCPISVRWNDMDALGHVNNIYYFEYFQIARGPYMLAVCPQWDWEKNMFVIAHIECDFIKEITIKNSELSVKVRTILLSNKSFEMEYLVVSKSKDGNEMLHAKGKSINVMIDITAKKATEIPDWLRNDLIAFEPGLK